MEREPRTFSRISKAAFACALIVCIAGINNVCAQRSDFFNVDFSKADSVAALYPRHPLKDLKVLAEKLTSPFNTEVEKFRSIFRWVTHNIDYDVELYLKDIARKQEYKNKPAKLKQWKKTFANQVTGHMLIEYKTVCSGYAQLVDDLCAHAGISSVVVEGTGRNAITSGTSQSNHAWNSVKLDGKWYLCDATWAAGSVDLDAHRFRKDYSESYFLTAPQYFIRDHYPADSSWTLLLHKPTRAEFFQQPIIYRGAIALQLNTITPNTGKVTVKAGEKFMFTFTSNRPGPFEKATVNIKSKGSDEWIYPPVWVNDEGAYAFEHTFAGKGVYRVTIFLRSLACVEYTVTVK